MIWVVILLGSSNKVNVIHQMNKCFKICLIFILYLQVSHLLLSQWPPPQMRNMGVNGTIKISFEVGLVSTWQRKKKEEWRQERRMKRRKKNRHTRSKFTFLKKDCCFCNYIPNIVYFRTNIPIYSLHFCCYRLTAVHWRDASQEET